MTESNQNTEISDKNYLDENFINSINSLNNDNFSTLFTYFIENYNAITSQSDFSQISNILISELKTDISFNNFYRQIKYLINKGVYLRLSKKFLVDLINLGLEEDKVSIIRDIQKANLDKLTELINKSQNDSNNNYIKGINKIIDVEIKTQMPIYNGNYEAFINNEEKGKIDNNEDVNKQNVFINFKLNAKNICENNFKNNENANNKSKGNLGYFQNLNIKMNKVQLAEFYAEIEKIQENLDKLC